MNRERPSVAYWSTMKSPQERWLNRYTQGWRYRSRVPTLSTRTRNHHFMPDDLRMDDVWRGAPAGERRVA